MSRRTEQNRNSKVNAKGAQHFDKRPIRTCCCQFYRRQKRLKAVVGSGRRSLFLDSCSKAEQREVGCTVSSGSCVPISRCAICSLARLQRKSAMRHSMTRQRAGVAWRNVLVSAFLSVKKCNRQEKQQSIEIVNLTTNTHTALFMPQSN